MSLPTPLTLVVPTFNRGDLIGETLASALDQTSPFAAVVVVDNGSTDDTARVVSQFGARVQLISTTNVGVQAARNLGVQACRTAHVSLCDSDDLLTPDYVQTVQDALTHAPELDALYCNFVNFDHAQVTVDKFSQAPAGWFEGAVAVAPRCLEAPHLARRALDFQPLFPSGMVLRKAFYDALGGFDPAFKGVGAEDLEFALRVAAQGRVGLLQDVRVRIRRHAGNDSRRAAYMLEGEAFILAHALAHHPGMAMHQEILRREIERRLAEAFECYFGEGDMPRAAAVLQTLQSPPAGAKARIKRWITRSPAWCRGMLWRWSQNRATRQP